MADSGFRDRVEGTLVGLAAGDRNGGPIRMALRLAEGLAGRGRFDPGDVLARYLAWWREGAFDTGPTAAGVLTLIDGGTDPVEAVRRVHERSGGRTAGINPAHRCPPLAMASSLRDEDLPGCAIEEARLTHQDPLAGEVAAAVAVLCRSLIRRSPWDEALDRAGRGRVAEVVRALDSSGSGPLSHGGFAPEVLGAAVRFVARPEGFAAAVEGSIAFAGPANYCPVLVGAIGGARWGAAAIPDRMRERGDVGERVRAVAARLGDDW
jgi:ADP-ribosyl-[dinitrogen reductase] hydrolase